MLAWHCHRNECRKGAVQALMCYSSTLSDHCLTGAIATRDRHRNFSQQTSYIMSHLVRQPSLAVCWSLTGKSISPWLSRSFAAFAESTGDQGNRNPRSQLQAGAAVPLGACTASPRYLPGEAALSSPTKLWPKRHEPLADRPCQHLPVQQHI